LIIQGTQPFENLSLVGVFNRLDYLPHVFVHLVERSEN
jgi:hypothetical protein